MNAGGTLLGGTGAAASGALTVTGAITLASGSVVQLALGAGTNSQIKANGGIVPDADQQFSFLDPGASAGTTYASLITGVAADPGSQAGWSIANPGWAGTFAYNAGTQAIDFPLTAVAESSAYGPPGAGSLAGLAVVRRRRRR